MIPIETVSFAQRPQDHIDSLVVEVIEWRDEVTLMGVRIERVECLTRIAVLRKPIGVYICDYVFDAYVFEALGLVWTWHIATTATFFILFISNLFTD